MGLILFFLGIFCLITSIIRVYKRNRVKRELGGSIQKIKRHGERRHILSTHDIYTFVQHKKAINPTKSFTYAFDTNILLQDPRILPIVANHTDFHIVISDIVRSELDYNKDKGNSAARVVLRNISILHKDGKLTLLPPKPSKSHNNDDRIINQYVALKGKSNIIFVTNDNNARTTARLKGLECIELDFENDLLREKLRKSRSGVLMFLGGLYSLSLSISIGLTKVSGEAVNSFEIIFVAFFIFLLFLFLWFLFIFIPYKMFERLLS